MKQLKFTEDELKILERILDDRRNFDYDYTDPKEAEEWSSICNMYNRIAEKLGGKK